MFTFTPLLGAQSTSPASQSLLEFDGGIKVLIDVGWDENFDVESLKEIEKHAPTLSFVLLTHATIAHVGALAHCRKHIPQFKDIPVYATQPVINLGRTLLQDMYDSTPLAYSVVPADTLAESSYSLGNNPKILMRPPTPADITNCFEAINDVSYSALTTPQKSPWSPSLGDFQITAYRAGHTLGGTVWHLQYGMESVVYSVDWNMTTENVIPGADLLEETGLAAKKELGRPTAMICSSRGSGIQNAVQCEKRDESLISLIRDTVAKGGSVLIPSDSSNRILELAYLLENAWAKDSSLTSATVYLTNRRSRATMQLAKTMSEWMVKDPSFDKDTDFKHVTLLEQKWRVERMLASTEPRVILASDTSLEWGYSRAAIKNLASDPRNLVVLTEPVEELAGTHKGLGRFLWELWNESNPLASAEAISASGSQVTLRSARAAALEGRELPLYQQYLATQRQLQDTMQVDSGTALETSGDRGDNWSASTSTTSEDSDDEYQGRLLNTATILRHTRKKLGLSDEELGVKILIQRKNVYDWDVRGKKGEEKIFPFTAKQRRVDDFGEMIRPEDFVRAGEEDEMAGETVKGKTEKDKEGRVKRNWISLADRSVDGGRQNKHRRIESNGQGPTNGGDGSDNEIGEESDRIEGPSKVILEEETLQLDCRIAFVDFSGLIDRHQLGMTLKKIEPRKLILIAGSQSETQELAEHCRSSLQYGVGDGKVDVFTPELGTSVDASVETNAWFVKLSRSMVRNLHWQKIKGLGVVAITGRLAAASLGPAPEEEEGGAKKKAKLEVSSTAEDEKMDATPILDVVPSNVSVAVRSVAQSIHVGDLRLQDLRKFLQAAGMTADLLGMGMLLVNGTVTVKIDKAAGEISVDGGAYHVQDPNRNGTAFYKVRRKIYEGLAVVAGGQSV